MPGLVPRQDPPTATGGRLAPPREGTRQRVSRLKATGTQQKNSFRIGTWNVRTMTPGISEDLRTIKDSRKTAVINNELLRLQIDIAGLQETRLADSGRLREKDYTFFWQGKKVDETREYGVGFAVRNTLLPMIEPSENGSERILTMRMQTSEGPVNFISAYAPTLYSSDEAKDQFYDQLHRILQDTPSQEQLFLIGDFNARVGTDLESWPTCLGRHGIGKMNDNGQRLLELCTWHNLCITNTFFQTKPQHKVSWMHPRSKLWHQIDFVITRRNDLKNVHITRSYQSADCDTDHSLVACKIRLKPKKIHRAKPLGKPRIDVGKTHLPEVVKTFTNKLEEAFCSTQHIRQEQAVPHWTQLRGDIYSNAKQVFGVRKRRSDDWFEASCSIINPVLEKKRAAMLKHKQKATRKTTHTLRSARGLSQKTARRCANDYWLNLAQGIQTAADSGNIGGVYSGIKKAVGPTKSKSAPLKTLDGTVIHDKGKQMERWIEHYAELLSRETSVTADALQDVETLPCMTELDELPTEEELSDAIDCLSSGKAPGMDGIPPEVIKCGKPVLLDELQTLLCECWEEGEVPQDMRDCNIITLYKNKGDRSDCNNYRGISLLSIVGKIFARVILKRLQTLAARVYPESQCGFRAGRSTMDMIFSLRQLQEKCREQRKPLYMAFIDLTKAFDLISRDGLFQILSKIGCPPKLLSITKSFHTNMKGVVQFDGSTSDAFDITSGVKQGCVLAPTLFGIFFAVMLKQAFRTSTEGIYFHTRSDGGLYNLSRLKAKTKIRKTVVRDLLFADDAAIVTHSEDDLQALMDKISSACTAFGLTISIKKTNIMAQGTSTEPEISICDSRLDVVKDFTYLGSTMSDDLSLDKELNRRIGRACTTFAKLTERVWQNKKLTINTKIAVYRACVLSTLLYGSECWTLYAHQKSRLNTFHMKNLRRILNISWDDYITNNEVLRRAGIDSLHTILQQRRLRWLGHVCRMPDGRIPKDILFGQLASGTRGRGRPHLRFKDVCKGDLVSAGIEMHKWEDLTANRDLWRHEIHQGSITSEEKLRQTADDKREERKQKARVVPVGSVYICSTCGRDCHSRIGLYSHCRKCSNTN